MKSLIAMTVAAFFGSVAAQQNMQGCDPNSNWQIYSDPQCREPGQWKGSGILPMGDDWSRRCYNPTRRMLVRESRDQISQLQQTANMVTDENWPTIRKEFEKQGMNLQALGTNLTDGQATINAYVQVLKMADVEKLQQIMGKNMETSLHVMCSRESIQVQIFKENGDCGRDSNGVQQQPPRQQMMLRWGECIRIKDVKPVLYYKFYSPMASLATNAMKATFASVALALASLMY